MEASSNFWMDLLDGNIIPKLGLIQSPPEEGTHTTVRIIATNLWITSGPSLNITAKN